LYKQKTDVKKSKSALVFLLVLILVVVVALWLVDGFPNRDRALVIDPQPTQSPQPTRLLTQLSPNLTAAYDEAKNLYTLGFNFEEASQIGPTSTMEIYDQNWGDQQAENELCSIVNSGKHNIVTVLTHRRLKDEGPGKRRGQLLDSTIFYSKKPGAGNNLRMRVFDTAGHANLSEEDRYTMINQDVADFCDNPRYRILDVQVVGGDEGANGRNYLHSAIVYYTELK